MEFDFDNAYQNLDEIKKLIEFANSSAIENLSAEKKEELAHKIQTFYEKMDEIARDAQLSKTCNEVQLGITSRKLLSHVFCRHVEEGKQDFLERILRLSSPFCLKTEPELAVVQYDNSKVGRDEDLPIYSFTQYEDFLGKEKYYGIVEQEETLIFNLYSVYEGDRQLEVTVTEQTHPKISIYNHRNSSESTL